MNTIEKKLKDLKVINISKAGFEYLYDENPENRGHIDPNPIQTGAYPISVLNSIFLHLREHIINENQNTQLDEKLLNEVQTILEKSYTVDSSKQLAEYIVKNFYQVLSFKVTEQDQKLLTEALKNLKDIVEDYIDTAYFKNDDDLLKTAFKAEHSFGLVSLHFWKSHHHNLIHYLYKLVESGKDLAIFNNKFLKNVLRYYDFYLDSQIYCGGYIKNEKTSFHLYKVPWEKPDAYIAQYNLSIKYPNIESNVYMDLDSKTNLYSLLPFASLFSLLSPTKKDKIFKLIRFFEKSEDEKSILLTFKDHKKEFPYIRYDKTSKEGHVYFNNGIKFKVKHLVPPEDNLAKYYSTCSSLFEAFPKKHLDITYPQHKFIYLINLINAKSLYFSIYKKMEAKYKLGIQYPRTLITQKTKIKFQDIPDYITDNKVVVKIGNKASKSGTDVIVFDSTKNEHFVNPFKSAVIQKYIPSQIFKYKEQKLHGHIRKLSILNSKGDVHHLGYAIKLAIKNQSNSSGFISFWLIYNEEKIFQYGCMSGRKPVYFTSLADMHLEPTLSGNTLNKLLDDVKQNWLVGIYYLNKFFEEDFKEKINQYTKDRIIDLRYRLK